jgi:LPS-assembly protein
VRADGYDYRDIGGVAGADDRFVRTVGLASLDVRWPLVRPGNTANWRLEPRVNLTYASDPKDSARVLNEETPYFELDSSAILRPLAAAGNDLWAPGARLSAGLTAGVDIADTLRASAFVGRQWRDTVSSAFNRASNLDRSASDWVGEVDVVWRDNLRLAGRLRFDGETGTLVRSEASARAAFWRVEADVRYHDFARDAARDERVNRELETSARFKITQNWRAFAALNRDLLDGVNLAQRYGVVFNDDCTEFRLFFERTETVNRFLDPSQAIRFQIAFRTLGALDDSEFD